MNNKITEMYASMRICGQILWGRDRIISQIWKTTGGQGLRCRLLDWLIVFGNAEEPLS